MPPAHSIFHGNEWQTKQGFILRLTDVKHPVQNANVVLIKVYTANVTAAIDGVYHRI